MEQSKSNSIGRNVGFLHRVSYLYNLVKMNARRTPPPIDLYIDDAKAIAKRFEEETGRSASESHVVEIGFGSRPHRAFALQSQFAKVTAVDLSQPVFGFRDFVPAIRQNGPLPATKSLIRAVIFDRGEWPEFHRQMRAVCPNYHPDKTKLVVSSAADQAFWDGIEGKIDYIYSTDVFEHIPRPELVRMMELARSKMDVDAVCITRPCVFTGITGGHDLNWYTSKVANNPRPETAWHHLWSPDFMVDTYVNGMSRNDFVEIFEGAGFHVAKQACPQGRLGEEYLTPEIRQKLGDKYDDSELFSNLVEFVLKPNIMSRK